MSKPDRKPNPGEAVYRDCLRCAPRGIVLDNYYNECGCNLSGRVPVTQDEYDSGMRRFDAKITESQDWKAKAETYARLVADRAADEAEWVRKNQLLAAKIATYETVPDTYRAQVREEVIASVHAKYIDKLKELDGLLVGKDAEIEELTEIYWKAVNLIEADDDLAEEGALATLRIVVKKRLDD